jgi:hypothetical protein
MRTVIVWVKPIDLYRCEPKLEMPSLDNLAYHIALNITFA